MTPVADRFWPKVNKDGPVPDYRPDLGPCWLWTGALRNGYGALGRGRRGDGVHQAHRLAYELLVGPIPENLSIDHLCRTRACVNPAHMEPVPIGINVLRGDDNIAAKNLAKTHCPHGHEYTPDNTYYQGKRSQQGRRCRACRQCIINRWGR